MEYTKLTDKQLKLIITQLHERFEEEDEIEEISDLIEDVRNIMIAGAIRMIERDNREVSVRSVTSAVRLLAQNTIKYYMTGVLNDRQ